MRISELLNPAQHPISVVLGPDFQTEEYVIEIEGAKVMLKEAVNFCICQSQMVHRMAELMEWQAEYYQSPPGPGKDRLLGKCKSREKSIRDELAALKAWANKWEALHFAQPEPPRTHPSTT